MSDDLDKKIQQIAQMLGQDKVPDNLKSLVSLFASSMGNKEETAPKASEDEHSDGEKAGGDEASENNEMTRKVKKVMEGVKGGNDPRINLLHAIKPFMNSKRQKKISNAVQLLQITSMARLMNNNDK